MKTLFLGSAMADWSEKVKTKWHPPAGFFDQSGADIAQGLLKASKTPGQASQRLHFYINRAGSNLKGDAKKRLDAAAKIIAKAVEGFQSESVDQTKRIPYVKKRLAATVTGQGEAYQKGDYKAVGAEVARRRDPTDIVWLYGFKDEGNHPTVLTAVLTDKNGKRIGIYSKNSEFFKEKGYQPNSMDDEKLEFIVKFPAKDLGIAQLKDESTSSRRRRRSGALMDGTPNNTIQVFKGTPTVETADEPNSLYEDDPNVEETQGGRKLRQSM